MHVYKVQIAASLYNQLGLRVLTFSNKQKAIDAVKTALLKAKITFTIREGENTMVFFNDSGGELATIVPA